MGGTRICLGFKIYREIGNRTYMGSTHKLDRDDLVPLEPGMPKERYEICNTQRCIRILGELVQFLEPLEARVAAERKKIEDEYKENKSQP